MRAPPASASPSAIPGRRIVLAAGALARAVAVVYANSFSIPFVFDDVPSILANPSIRHLWPM